MQVTVNNAISIIADAFYSIAVKSYGTVWACGDNSNSSGHDYRQIYADIGTELIVLKIIKTKR